MFSPFFEFNDRFSLMDRLLASQQQGDGPAWMSLRDTGESLVLVADLPGAAENDVDVSIEADVLTLRAKSAKKIPDGHKLVRAERPQLRVLEQIELPVRVDSTLVTATLSDGVLTVTLPKAEGARPRKIPVGSGAAKNEALS